MKKQILLLLTGSIAAYKSLELIRLLKKAGYAVQPVMTESAKQFVTPLSVAALSEAEVYSELFSLKDETQMGHIRLSRESDLVVVAPASANSLAKLANGLADDLASTVLLATDKPVMVAPAMNPKMWEHPATQRNIAQLKQDGVIVLQPDSGTMACGETGEGRMMEPEAIVAAIEARFHQPLKGKKAVVTSGATIEPIDPVRFISNHSSGKQGHAIAESLRDAGADVTLITGKTSIPNPAGMTLVHVDTADAMLEAVKQALPADIAVCVAAVSDWKMMQAASAKMKKEQGTPTLTLTENPDILRFISKEASPRPALVIGFAAETGGDLHQKALAKRLRKGCDWLLANDVSAHPFGGDNNQMLFVTPEGSEVWGEMSKKEVARKLVGAIIQSTTPTVQRQTTNH
jgi:phosphopantothenoylcysteine decarboxylase/phosphopantothenate--cysteine ligase